MIKFPKAKVMGKPLNLDFVETDQHKQERIAQDQFLLEAKRYRYVRENMGLPPEEFDKMVDDHIATDKRNGL